MSWKMAAWGVVIVALAAVVTLAVLIYGLHDVRG